MKFKLVFCVVPEGSSPPAASQWRQIKIAYEGFSQRVEPLAQACPCEELRAVGEMLGHQVARSLAGRFAKDDVALSDALHEVTTQ